MLPCKPEPRPLAPWRRIKSLFASFSPEKEDSSFFEKKEAKKLLRLGLRDVACRTIENRDGAK
jgi:hypothetical protein